MLRHLGRACRDARSKAGLLQSDIASACGTSHATVSRFETDGIVPRLIGVDELVNAYARELGVDPAELWREAITRWARDDEIPA
jgi:transcriptional regulator with XRE-family HTH domain